MLCLNLVQQHAVHDKKEPGDKNGRPRDDGGDLSSYAENPFLHRVNAHNGGEKAGDCIEKGGPEKPSTKFPMHQDRRQQLT